MPKALLKNGINIHYQRVGEGPDIVFLHGLMGNLAVWHLKIVPILRHHFRVTTVDLRGHGYSDMPATGYSVDDLAGDLLGLLDALEIGQADLVGHSYGADIALCFALHHPGRVKRVVAIGPGCRRWPRPASSATGMAGPTGPIPCGAPDSRCLQRRRPTSAFSCARP
jgi:pimeloyl-ACP methyl ester carboxylesterase